MVVRGPKKEPKEKWTPKDTPCTTCVEGGGPLLKGDRKKDDQRKSDLRPRRGLGPLRKGPPVKGQKHGMEVRGIGSENVPKKSRAPAISPAKKRQNVGFEKYHGVTPRTLLGTIYRDGSPPGPKRCKGGEGCNGQKTKCLV